ncbi:MAG TPA: hypothetical protein DCG75_01120 [Bacteroidales bacterium]|nr:hypothetical protein [Bacteroidales bacterium]
MSRSKNEYSIMKDLEVKTYNFAVQGIGLIKSLEKEFPELVNNDLKQSMGSVSINFIDALNAQENEDFAKNIKACYANTQKSAELLHSLGVIENKTLEEQRLLLINDSKNMIDKLDSIISKLIY